MFLGASFPKSCFSDESSVDSWAPLARCDDIELHGLFFSDLQQVVGNLSTFAEVANRACNFGRAMVMLWFLLHRWAKRWFSVERLLGDGF